MRQLGVELPGLSAKKTERRPYPPGQHGQARRKLSEYGLRLREKQKVRANYGVGERQLRRVMTEARASSGVTGSKLIELLERRLDNVVFRSGFARTIPSARQLVCHGHVLVDGKRVDIASYRVSPGQTISFREKSQKIAPVEAGLTRTDLLPPAWLEINKEGRSSKMTIVPDETSVPFALQVQLVIEYYSQRL
jgi:small subunit ribosomal protein S4